MLYKISGPNDENVSIINALHVTQMKRIKDRKFMTLSDGNTIELDCSVERFDKLVVDLNAMLKGYFELHRSEP